MKPSVSTSHQCILPRSFSFFHEPSRGLVALYQGVELSLHVSRLRYGERKESMDGGDRKRRKIGSEEGGQDGGGDGADEEEKMETFFALIRSAKDVLQRVAREPRERVRQEEEERAKKAAVWTPTFRPEDFAGDDKSLSGSVSGVQPGPSNSRKEEEEEDGKAKREKQKEDDDLDLKLSL